MTDGKTGMLRYLHQAWLVLVLSICFGAALAGVENVTRPRIARNVKDFIARKLVEMFGEGTATDAPTVLEVRIAGRARRVSCYPALKAGRRVGWGILAEGKGYDTLTLLVGVDETVGRLTGFRVVSSLETPGIGDRIEKPEFYRQFEQGKVTGEPLVPVPEATPASGNQVHTISGATYSSKGVVNTINENLAAVREKLIAFVQEGG